MADLAILIPSLSGGGLEKSILRLAQELNKQSVLLEFVVINTIDSAYKVPEELDFIDLNTSRMRYSLIPLVRYLKKTKPRVLFSAGTPLNTITILAKIISGYPKLLVVGERNHLSSTVQYSSRYQDKLLPYLVRVLYPFADFVLAVSRSVAEDVIAVGNLKKGKVQVVHNLFNIDDIVAKASEPTGIEWIDKPEVPILISIGRLVPQKAYDILLKAFSVVKRHKDCRLIILGHGKKRVELQHLAEELQVAKDVFMPGFVRNPYSFLSKANLLVHTSIWEGLPAVLIEALACGVPVVSADSPGGASEILENGNYGTLVPPRNPEALADAILAQLEEITEPERLVERARCFSSDRVLQEYMDVFEIGPSPKA